MYTQVTFAAGETHAVAHKSSVHAVNVQNRLTGSILWAGATADNGCLDYYASGFRALCLKVMRSPIPKLICG